MQKKVKIQVQLPPERNGDHLQAEEGEDQVRLLTECYEDHLQAEQGEDQVQLTPESMVVT